MTSEEDHDASAIDPAKLRRFAIGVALIMWVYVVAGGSQTANDEFRIEALKIDLSKPGILLWLVPIVSIYATVRYWWYGIQIPVTRKKIRKYLRNTRSLLVIKTYEEAYRSQLKAQTTASSYLRAHQELEAKVPPGLIPFHFIIFTDAVNKPDEMYLLHLCRNRIDTYFPGITVMDFAVDETQDHLVWASPSKLGFKARARAAIENCDSWLPISLNAIGLLAYVAYLLYSVRG